MMLGRMRLRFDRLLASREPPCGAAVVLATTLVVFAGCAVTPPYQPPKPAMPAEWKVEAPWRVATPADDAPKGPWWRRFNDDQLSALIAKALQENATLAVAASRLQQARATVDVVGAAQYPQLAAALREQRLHISANRPLTNYAAPNFRTTQSDHQAQLTASYELDFFGRVRSAVDGALAASEQSAADLENVRLLVTADLATAYFNLRATDIELDVLARALELQRKTLGVVSARRDLGAASGVEVSQQQALVDSTLTQVDILRRQRAVFQNAMATLVGTPAPQFALAPEVRLITPPAIPIGVPSDILERRPDVASAERAMAAANAQVGVAVASYYPSIALGGAYGVQTRAFERLLESPSVIWSLGLSLLQPILDGGRLKANEAFARAGYQATVENYRRVVLTAMQEVEDGILGLSALESASTQAEVAVASARKVFDMATARYEGGIASSLEVITAQQALLTAERLSAQLVGQRLLTTVFLVKALGGDWAAADKITQH